VVPVCSEFLGVHSLGFLRHEETALLFPIGDTATAARHVHRLGENTALLDEVSRAGRAVAETFPMEWSQKRWLTSLQETLARPVRGLGETAAKSLTGRVGRGSRLERLGLPAGASDWARRLFRRWPRFADGWEEWPGTLSRLDGDSLSAMLDELAHFDEERRWTVPHPVGISQP
jgi:hypothetical protein